MKLLLTSLGLTNDSIASALTELVGKEPNDTKIAYIPTGSHCSRVDKGYLIDNLSKIKDYGYYIDIIEITALSTEQIKSALNDVDVIFFGGGNAFYLSYWMQQKGLFEMLPEILETKVFAGISAGSMMAGANFRMSSQALGINGDLSDETLENLGPAGESSARSLKLVDFVFKPHLNSAESSDLRTEEYVRSVANRVSEPIYALDDQSALKIVDGNIEVVSEGKWLLLNSDL